MHIGRWVTIVGGAAVLLGMVTVGGPVTRAQEATPEAAETAAGRPAHIHTGTCENVGEVVAPLNNLTPGPGEQVGQAGRAALAENSYSTVPLTLDAILAEDHVVNIHLSAEEIQTYIACGEIGGNLTSGGSLVVGLRELNDSGFTGIAFLGTAADGASTDVSAFIAPVLVEGMPAADDADAAADDATASESTPEAATLPAASPMAGHDMGGTPAADTSDDATMAGEQVDVSLVEFAIAMPETLPAGPVTFSVTNDGTITHSFEIESADLEEELETSLEPGQSGTLTVDLAPGTYEVYCPIGNHADQGMRIEVTVA